MIWNERTRRVAALPSPLRERGRTPPQPSCIPPLRLSPQGGRGARGIVPPRSFRAGYGRARERGADGAPVLKNKTGASKAPRAAFYITQLVLLFLRQEHSAGSPRHPQVPTTEPCWRMHPAAVQRCNISQRARALGWTLLGEAGPIPSGRFGCGAAHCSRTVPVAIRSLMSSGDEIVSEDFDAGIRLLMSALRQFRTLACRGKQTFRWISVEGPSEDPRAVDCGRCHLSSRAISSTRGETRGERDSAWRGPSRRPQNLIGR